MIIARPPNDIIVFVMKYHNILLVRTNIILYFIARIVTTQNNTLSRWSDQPDHTLSLRLHYPDHVLLPWICVGITVHIVVRVIHYHRSELNLNLSNLIPRNTFPGYTHAYTQTQTNNKMHAQTSSGQQSSAIRDRIFLHLPWVRRR